MNVSNFYYNLYGPLWLLLIPFSSKDGILLYSILLWEIKFAWVYFWRAHNKPNKWHEWCYLYITDWWLQSFFPLCFLETTLGIGFWQHIHFLFLNQVMTQGLYKWAFIYHGLVSFEANSPGSVILLWFLDFSLSLRSQEQLLQSLIWQHNLYFMPQTTSLLKFHCNLTCFIYVLGHLINTDTRISAGSAHCLPCCLLDLNLRSSIPFPL